MTEDDTFRVLTRVPFSDLSRKRFSFDGYIFRPFTSSEILKLKQLGWTELEYKIAHANNLTFPVDKYFWHDDYQVEIERLKNEANY
jgi:hypothetical protein